MVHAHNAVGQSTQPQKEGNSAVCWETACSYMGPRLCIDIEIYGGGGVEGEDHQEWLESENKEGLGINTVKACDMHGCKYLYRTHHYAW